MVPDAAAVCHRRRVRSSLPGVALIASLALAPPAGAAVGDISTVAGTGTAGFNGDGIAATSAQLTTPVHAIPAPGGGFLIADQVNFRVRKVAADGTITTLAGTGARSPRRATAAPPRARSWPRRRASPTCPTARC